MGAVDSMRPVTEANLRTVPVRLATDGWAWVSSARMCELLLSDPASAVGEFLGVVPERFECMQVTPVQGSRSIVTSSRDGRLHVDAHPLLSPTVVIMSCYQQAQHGGQTLLADSWAVLSKIAITEPDLYPQLFRAFRKFQYPGRSTYAPTFSIRAGSLACHHATFPQPADEVGIRFQAQVDSAPVIEFKLGVNELYIIDNRRMLHGRRPFKGSRHLQRLQAWLPTTFPAPPQFVSDAMRARDAHLKVLADHPAWVQRRFGTEAVELEHLDASFTSQQEAVLDGVLRNLVDGARLLADEQS